MTLDWLHMQIGFEAELWRWLVVLCALVVALFVTFGLFLLALRRRERMQAAALSGPRVAMRDRWREVDATARTRESERAWNAIFDAELTGRGL